MPVVYLSGDDYIVRSAGHGPGERNMIRNTGFPQGLPVSHGPPRKLLVF